MAWVDSDTSRPQYNAEGQLTGYAGSSPMYVPDKIDDYLVDEYTGVARDPMEAARMLLRGAGMQPGSYNNGAGIGYDAIEKLYASDPRFAQYFPDKRVVYQDINNLMNRQTEIDNNPGFDFGKVLLGGAATGIGALSGGFGLGDLLNGLDFGSPNLSFASGGMPTQVAGWSSDMPFNIEDYYAALQDAQSLPSGYSVNMSDFYNAMDAGDAAAGIGGTPPSPTVSIPGYGDVYGSWQNILKNINNIPGLSSLLKGASGGGGSTLSALQRLLSGSGDSGDAFSALGGVLPSLLGMYASSQQTGALKDLAGKYAEYGAPYRQQLADITADPSKFYNSTAAQQGVNTVLNKLSIGGNPSGSPYKQQLAIDSLWNDYGKERDRLAGFGGLTNYNAAAPNLDAQAVSSQGNMYNALGAGLNDIFNPKTSLADLLKQGKIA